MWHFMGVDEEVVMIASVFTSSIGNGAGSDGVDRWQTYLAAALRLTFSDAQ